jgi:hypothetical protein
VSVERGERPGVAAAFSRAELEAQPLLVAATVGGLENYWGQQFVRYDSADAWPRETFADFDTYTKTCAQIEGDFSITGDENLTLPRSGNIPYRTHTPRLLTSIPGELQAGLFSMRYAIECQLQRLDAETHHTKCTSLLRTNQGWQAQLANGATVESKRIALAAGVLGSAKILCNSFLNIQQLKFTDHSPWMAYTMGLRHVLTSVPRSSSRHFNALTVEDEQMDKCNTFASIYNMGNAEINLLLASTIAKTSPIFRGWKAPSIASLLCPVQVWTPHSFDDVTIATADNRVVTHAPSELKPTDDDHLRKMLDYLKNLGAKRVSISRTTPGFGFHYHNLRVASTADRFQAISEFLKIRTGSEIICCDASSLTGIGLRPHTLTAMANSYAILQRELSKA